MLQKTVLFYFANWNKNRNLKPPHLFHQSFITFAALNFKTK